jgi:hypothetical protein
VTPGKLGGGGTYHNGEAAGRREESSVTAAFERVLKDRSAARQRGKKEGRGGRSGRGSATWHGGVMGPGPDLRAMPNSGPSVARSGDVRRARVAG